ncbi:hypothetical protein GGS23DRAFT_546509 [Durotheca rogersii]|uniref:uncharacterized protein n=1 Tax=Durotheca rogersii TaxID=419775 RepID=UPI00221F3D7F|nr:uncharacterized protein GGS23DRAFT_546509 [Durotheca rogersii]KAI5868644.1 hypothetical protein GGS23DRAFT_546509 [Durotheca rogersii]
MIVVKGRRKGGTGKRKKKKENSDQREPSNYREVHRIGNTVYALSLPAPPRNTTRSSTRQHSPTAISMQVEFVDETLVDAQVRVMSCTQRDGRMDGWADGCTYACVRVAWRRACTAIVPTYEKCRLMQAGEGEKEEKKQTKTKGLAVRSRCPSVAFGQRKNRVDRPSLPRLWGEAMPGSYDSAGRIDERMDGMDGCVRRYLVSFSLPVLLFLFSVCVSLWSDPRLVGRIGKDSEGRVGREIIGQR